MYAQVNCVSRLNLELIVKTEGTGPLNTLGMIHHNTVNTTAFKNTFAICQQSKLSSPLSSTAWAYFEELRGLKNGV